MRSESAARGRRDYAILLLLARLGLRAGKVLRLTLDDIDWAHGQILVRSKKGPGNARHYQIMLGTQSRFTCGMIAGGVPR